jgi:hypothetical protein
MKSSTQRQSRANETLQRDATAAESADYVYDLLISLKKLAADRKQARLARLIEAAAMEAQFLTGQASSGDG